MQRLLTGLCCLLAGAALLLLPDITEQGVKTGMTVCIDVLLPSLFPFMALTGFATLSGADRLLALPLRPLFRLLGIPAPLAPAVLTGLIGGFPTGARTLATMVEHRQLSADDAALLIHCCISPGPAFVVTAVGQQMLGSAHLGWMLLVSQLAASLAVGAVVIRRSKKLSASFVKPLPPGEALVFGVQGACRGMVSVCCYVLLFSVLSAFLTPLLGKGWFGALAAGLLEVTNGCAAAAALHSYRGVLLTAFLIAFSGGSVLCQVTALLRGSGIRAKGLLASRLLCGLLSCVFMSLMMRFGSVAAPVFAPQAAPMAICSADRLLCALCLIGMAAMLLCHRLVSFGDQDGL